MLQPLYRPMVRGKSRTIGTLEAALGIVEEDPEIIITTTTEKAISNPAESPTTEAAGGPDPAATTRAGTTDAEIRGRGGTGTGTMIGTEKGTKRRTDGRRNPKVDLGVIRGDEKIITFFNQV